jgi:pimeloyl-ACP methyl ester carboxylesterase
MVAVINQKTSFARCGLTLNVSDQGGSGTPVLFQHGLCGDANQTREAFPLLDGYRRITLECRGHGKSEPGSPEQFSIANFTDDSAAFLDDLDAGSIVVGGISMGAAIALRLAVKRPDLVKGLILVRPAWIAASAPANMRPNAQVGALLAAHSSQSAREMFMSSGTAQHLANAAPDNLKSLGSFFDREPQEITAEMLLRISIDGPNVEEYDVTRLTIPTLILGHDQDFIHPFGYAETLAALIPNARLQRVTPKAISKDRYIADLHQAITQFLKESSSC